MFRQDLRHVNTNSDSEVLLNVLAHELQERGDELQARSCRRFSRRWPDVHRRCRGAYAVVAMIAGYGLLAFRDPYGIRPLVIGRNETEHGHGVPGGLRERWRSIRWAFKLLRDVAPGEAIFIDEDGNFHSRQCAASAALNPCIFEYVYLARPDSVMDGISVYETRLRHGRDAWPRRSGASFAHLDIDVVIPIPDSSRPCGAATGQAPGRAVPRRLRQEPLHRPHLHHAGPGDAQEIGAPEAQRHRRWSSRARTCCWSTIPSCAAPPAARSCRWRAKPARARCFSPRPRRRCASPTSTASTCRRAQELIATGRSDEEIAREIGADALIYQDLDALKAAVRAGQSAAERSFETSCFDGDYITGDVTQRLSGWRRSAARRDARHADGDEASCQLDLDLSLADIELA